MLNSSKIPPQATDIEELVLGAVMLERNAFKIANDKINSEVFYKEANRKIYLACENLNNKDLPIDILTVCNELKRINELEAVGGALYVSQLTNRIVSAQNIEFHCAILLQKYLQRKLISVTANLYEKCFDDSNDIFELIEEAESELEKAQNIYQNGQNIHISEFADKAEKQTIDRILSVRNNKTIGITTGLKNLDKMTGGFIPETIVVAARPSMGKTALMLNFAKQASKVGTVKIYELEMSGVRLTDRLIMSESNTDIDRYRSGYMNDDEFMETQAATEKIKKLNIFIDDKGSVNADYICRDARATKHKYKDLAMIIIDHCGLLEMNDYNRNNEIGKITGKFHKLRKELNIPVIMLFQLNRQVESRPDKRPQLSDLRDSGSIEQDADTVLLLYRPAYYDIKYKGNIEYPKNYGEIIIAKRRDGKVGTVPFTHNNGMTKFFDCDNIEDEGARQTENNLKKYVQDDAF